MNKILVLFFICFSTSIYSQNIIRGIVYDNESQETLIGANVVIENTTIGTTTNINGKFRLDLPDTSDNFINMFGKDDEYERINSEEIIL